MSIQCEKIVPKYKMRKVFAWGRYLFEAELRENFFEKVYFEVFLMRNDGTKA